MLRPILAALALLLAAPPVSAQEDPPVATEKTAREIDRLFAALRTAESEVEARVTEDAIWRRWFLGPTAEATAALHAANSRIRVWDLSGAIAMIDPLIAAHPDWAEAWNRRAFARFLQEDLDGSLADIDRALELEPRHFGALSGKARILMRQGRMELGQETLRRAVAIHPWIQERDMLIPAPGNDI